MHSETANLVSEKGWRFAAVRGFLQEMWDASKSPPLPQSEGGIRDDFVIFPCEGPGFDEDIKLGLAKHPPVVIRTKAWAVLH